MNTIYLAQNLKHLRNRRKVSQEVAALALDVKRSSYSSYENGGIEPNITTLLRMQTYYRVPLAVLITTDLRAMRESELGSLERLFSTVRQPV